FFFFQAEDGIRDYKVTGVQTCALPICRPSAGICDVAENCTGSSAGCPSDAFQPSSTQCRAAAGACDVAENCTGSSANCPADAVRSEERRVGKGGGGRGWARAEGRRGWE